MSPLFTPVILTIFAGIITLLTGLFKRSKKLIGIGLPAAALLLAWYIFASIPPNPGEEFDKIFGAPNRSTVTDIRTIKPTMMDGHFISFRISPADFETRIRPQFEPTAFTNFHLLRGQSLPSGWPAGVIEATFALNKQVDHQDILLHYDIATESAYTSVQYDSW